MSDTIRTFIAFKLPENVISTIGKIQKKIKSRGLKIRWVKPENIHLTLKFLGDIKSADQKAVEGAIETSVKGIAGVELTAGGLGVFPGLNSPRVIWVGVAGQMERLVALQKTIDQNLETLGFPKEKRPFKGHLTFGRIKGPMDTGKLVDSMKAVRGFEPEPFFADRVVLFKSDLKPSGAVYTELKSAALTDK